ncbi:hypothetical protein IVB45_17415 [Bradyrhizobium sp. 4]|uniref:hypothetical protein n=1 Tax=unclassified Bradyrhizobium TaxID=2631580 RepID=UPI001FF93086|nr:MULTISPECIES: hypothetical protein [unclassified Bradyrhizobium]MCK1402046.1 hypothetical protein [Bradyrhizobium sp. 39]MCK1751234.1 hypothetical protein [Bradyrhizobium sp. 135]UPJ38489.1 hypothetical protein IVB45_17415 [Bradyrhizobium sp. 4]
MDIGDAIEAAAGDRADQISADPARAASARRAVNRVRSTVTRFLDECPDDLTVFELKELLERGN